jgi:hypothetical protein
LFFLKELEDRKEKLKVGPAALYLAPPINPERRKVEPLIGLESNEWRPLMAPVRNSSWITSSAIVQSCDVPAADPTPHPGLRPFELDESDLFFGRDDCIDAMIQGLEETQFLAVLGSSGTGKSSLVKTGLVSGLEMDFSRWRVVEIRPNGDPLGKLAEALLQSLVSAGKSSKTSSAEAGALKI